ncbi:MAG: hypothetical protein AB7V45_15340 [Candidatus Krumholzibacteriia bacterium]
MRILVPPAGFAVVWTRAGRWLPAFLAGGRGVPFLERRALAYGVAPALCGLVFFLLRNRVHLQGDGGTLADNLAKGMIFHGLDFMIYFLYAQAFQWLGAGPGSQAYSVMAGGSILSGAVYVSELPSPCRCRGSCSIPPAVRPRPVWSRSWRMPRLIPGA